MISPSQRPLPDNTQHSQQTNIHAPGGIRTHNLSRRAAVDLRLRPRGRWDRRTAITTQNNNNCLLYIYLILLFHIRRTMETRLLAGFHCEGSSSIQFVWNFYQTKWHCERPPPPVWVPLSAALHNASHSTLPQWYIYQKDKRAKPGELHTKECSLVRGLELYSGNYLFTTDTK